MRSIHLFYAPTPDHRDWAYESFVIARETIYREIPAATEDILCAVLFAGSRDALTKYRNRGR